MSRFGNYKDYKKAAEEGRMFVPDPSHTDEQKKIAFAEYCHKALEASCVFSLNGAESERVMNILSKK